MIEKKLLPRKVGTIEAIENFLHELEKLATETEDYNIISDSKAWIEDICKDRNICPYCYSKMDEVWYSEGLIRQCNCKSKRISA